MFFSRPANVLAPGRAQVMSDGWETARRRDDGHDWLVVRLAVPGVLHHAVIDTTRFAGNAPGLARLSDEETGVEICRGPGWSRTPSTGSGSGAGIAPGWCGWTSIPTAASPGCAWPAWCRRTAASSPPAAGWGCCPRTWPPGSTRVSSSTDAAAQAPGVSTYGGVARKP